MKTHTRQVPATTNNITRGIINFLNLKGHFAFRVNTQGTFNPIVGSFRRIAPNDKGCPDILCCWNMPDTTSRFVGFEVKNESTKDKLSKDQIAFHTKIVAANGIVVVVKSYAHFLELYGKITNELTKSFVYQCKEITKR